MASYNAAQYGSFTICLTDHDNDYYQTPYQLTNLNNACYSGGTQFTTSGATVDGPKPACFPTTIKENRWYMFQAVAPTATISLSSSGVYRGELALYNTGATSLPLPTPTSAMVSNCIVESASELITITTATLTVGKWYYIEVDDYGNPGSYQLCINNVGTTYYAIANGDWHNNTTWSFSPGGAACALTTQYPQQSDIANIQGYAISVTQAEKCAGLNITAQSSATSLSVNGASLKVNGTVSMTNPGNALDASILVQNSGTLTVVDNINYTCSGAGATGAFNFTLGSNSSDNCVATVGLNMVWTISGTGTTANAVTINGGSSLSVANNLTMSSATSSNVITITANNTSTLSVGQDVTFSTSIASTQLISLNNTSVLKVGRQFNQSTSGYGHLVSAPGATLEFNGTTASSYFFGTSTSPEAFTLYNLKINNTFSSAPKVNLTGTTTLQSGGSLILSNGILVPTSTSLLIMNAGTSVSPAGGSATSYVDGPMQKIGSTDFIFPTGNSGKWARVAVTNLSASTTFQAQYFKSIYKNAVVAGTMAATPTPALDHVSTLEYWQLDRTAGSGNANVTLYWEDASYSQIADCSDLQVGHYNGAAWENASSAGAVVNGCTGTTPGITGSITTSALVTSFSPFTFGSLSSNLSVNPLPVTWLSFEPVLKQNRTVEVRWSTATELHNNYFAVMRSADGLNFEEVARVYAGGNSEVRKDYLITDEVPDGGAWYYQIKQVDFNGDLSVTKIKSVVIRNADSAKLYPNPASDELFIDHAGSWENAKIEIYDAFGNSKQELNFAGSTETTKIIVTDLNAGVYFIRVSDIETGNIILTRTLIKA